MQLREGVTFHDGSAFDAASVKYQIDWIRNPANGAWSAGWLAPLETVEVVDERTCVGNSKNRGPASGVISNVPGYALSAKALQELGEQYDSQPQGTGAYMLEEASPGNFLKLKRNPNWWFAKA